MKKIFVILCIFIGLYLSAATASADSPLTSTPFYNAYMDLSIVAEAEAEGAVSEDIADFLYDKNNPIDVKAAVINAISWSGNSSANADKYCRIIYKKPLNKINTDKLRGDQLFCIGYLLAMDNYSDVTTSLRYLRLSEQKVNNSFTIQMIGAVVESMKPIDGIWDYIEPVLLNKGLKQDMRQDAVNIILDYMATYCEDGLQVSSNNIMLRNELSQTIYLYGTYSPVEGQELYQITKNSPFADSKLIRDTYGIWSVTITGVKNGSSSIEVTNYEGKKVIISFCVTSKGVYSKLNNSVAMYIGSTHSLIGQTGMDIRAKEVPFLKSKMPYVPVEYLVNTMGGVFKYDSSHKTYQIKYRYKSFELKSGSNSVKVNHKAGTLSSNTVLRNKVLFISVKDFVSLIGKTYIYSNGLIFITDPAKQVDPVKDDYILEEMASLTAVQCPTIHEPYAYEVNDKFGYKDYNGKVILEPVYTTAYEFHDGLAAVGVLGADGNEKFGYIDITGSFVIQPVYIKAGTFRAGLAPVMNDAGTLWGYIDTSGKLVIPYTYSDCTTFREGLAAVQVDGKWGYINTTGNYVIQPDYDSAQEFFDGVAVVSKGNINYIIYVSGKTIIIDNGTTEEG